MTDRKDLKSGSGHTPPSREENVPPERVPGAAVPPAKPQARPDEVDHDPHVEDVDVWHHGNPPRD